MKILILGADGMLGHQLTASFRDHHEVAGTVRQAANAYAREWNVMPSRLFSEVDAREFSAIRRIVDQFGPDAVINAVGIVKQRREAKNAIESIEVNSLLPHRLADLCSLVGSRLIHLSTDCVFSGTQGNYSDDALHDARDLYGRSKSMGEVEGPGVITLRTSIIGLELSRKTSLVEWFLAQSGVVRGFTKAIYSGFTTLEMARIIEGLLLKADAPSGIYNVSSDPIDKYSLLVGLKERLDLHVEIDPDADFNCDRSLDSTRFRATVSYQPPSWGEMLDELGNQILARTEGKA